MKANTGLSPGSVAAERAGKYLTFRLSGQEYGIGILKVREIIGMMTITSLPGAPDHVRGVINLRGKVIPIVSLRRRFAMADAEQTEESCIIVVGVEGSSGIVLMGVEVDAVSEVLDVRGDDVEEAPSLGDQVSTDFILGMAKIGNGVKILLDIDKVVDIQAVAGLGRIEDADGETALPEGRSASTNGQVAA